MADQNVEAGAPPLSTVVPCATCGAGVDPLRAARVAHIGNRFRYFCSGDCRRGFVPKRDTIPPKRPQRPLLEPSLRESSPPPATPMARTGAFGGPASSEELTSHPSSPAVPAAPEPIESGAESAPQLEEVVAPLDIGTLLLAISVVSAALSIALYLAGPSGSALTARVLLVLVGTGSLIAHALSPGRDPSEPHPLAWALAPVLCTAAAVAARVSNDANAASASTAAAWVILTVGATIWLVQWARRLIEAERESIAESLAQEGQRVVGDEVVPARADDLRPGEEIMLEVGGTAVVDATVIAGSARVQPWLGASTAVERTEGDPIVAGAKVLEGRVRAVVGWSGNDRAWLRLSNDPRRRADVFAPLPRFGRHLAERGGPIAAAIAALAAFSSDRDPIVVAQFAAAAHVALANGTVGLIAALYTAETVLSALRRGIAFRTADALDRAGKVSTAAFCARGTLLLGEPELANIEAFGPYEPETVLGALAGAESGASHPTAIAVLRAARARGIRPDGVRSPTVLPGLGVTAVASTGQPLVVGSRALMLRERISVAAAETRITELEAMGRTVILVALGGRLIGVVGLQDGLRPGARAAVQHLLDVGIEPVLLSGDARETCDALGRAVDIEHIRPEVLPAERGEEIRRLADGGATVAVLGRSPADDVALGAADVSVALDSAGASSAEWHVQLASDDVRDAAYALRLAHRLRRDALIGLTLALVPGTAAALLMAVGLTYPATVPLAALAGGLTAVFRLRSRR